MLATIAKCFLGQFADLRLHALHESRQVGMSFRPDVVDLLADDRPFLHAFSRGGYFQRVLLHGTDEMTNGVGKRIHQQRRRGDDQQEADDHQNGRGEPLLPADPAGEPLMQRIQRDRQDDRPDHQRQEWRKDLVAQHRECANQTGANQHIQQRRDDARCSNSASGCGSGFMGFVLSRGSAGHPQRTRGMATMRRKMGHFWCHSSFS